MNKEIRAEVQRLSGLDKATCSVLWSGLERVFREEVIHGVTIDIEGLGTFLPHKHPEYLQDDPASGQVMLYPPRITCRFRPADAATPVVAPAEAAAPHLQRPQLAALIGDYVKHTADEAERFLTALVEATVLRLQAGEEVTWTGFGTFRIVNFRDGESHRVAWVVDDKMRDGINSPFSCFEPVAVGQMEVAPTPSEPEEPAAPLETPAPADDAEADTTLPSEPEEPTVVEPEAKDEGPENVSQHPEEPSEIAPKRRMSARKWIFGGIIFLFLIIICNICAPHLSSKKEVAADTVAILVDSTTEGVADSVAVCIADTAVRAEEDSVPDWDEELPPVAPEPQAVSEATAARATVAAEMYLLDADGQRRTERVQPGDRLTLMARRLYGHKAFWVYIYEVNRDQLASPNNVTAGMTLNLPNPEYWQIDSASETSVQTALRRAAKLVGE
jgi:nucleoid DNA-binding protein/nucleoid-associated protein YgaU